MARRKCTHHLPTIIHVALIIRNIIVVSSISFLFRSFFFFGYSILSTCCRPLSTVLSTVCFNSHVTTFLTHLYTYLSLSSRIIFLHDEMVFTAFLGYWSIPFALYTNISRGRPHTWCHSGANRLHLSYALHSLFPPSPPPSASSPDGDIVSRVVSVDSLGLCILSFLFYWIYVRLEYTTRNVSAVARIKVIPRTSPSRTLKKN